MSTSRSSEYYVYAFLREKDSVTGPRLSPYYIGKGCRNRAFSSQRRIAPLPARKEYIVFIQEDLKEQEAFDLEKYCIALYGRADQNTGILRNLTDGGEGASGNIPSVETRQRWSQQRKGEGGAFWGRKHTDETKRKMSEAQLGEKHYLWGKSPSEETRKKMSESRCLYLCEFTDPSGNCFTVKNLAQFAKDHGLTSQCLYMLIHGKIRKHKGWAGKIIEKLK